MPENGEIENLMRQHKKKKKIIVIITKIELNMALYEKKQCGVNS